jgi:hypothetical protein
MTVCLIVSVCVSVCEVMVTVMMVLRSTDRLPLRINTTAVRSSRDQLMVRWYLSWKWDGWREHLQTGQNVLLRVGLGLLVSGMETLSMESVLLSSCPIYHAGIISCQHISPWKGKLSSSELIEHGLLLHRTRFALRCF